VILVGVTFLFAIASNNGTVDWLIHASVRAVGGRTAAIPWVFFLVTAILTASGAVVPGAVAIVAPIGIGFALQYGINPLLMGLMIINGATAGGFSPISVFGSIVNGVVERNDLAENAFLLFVSSFVVNLLLSVVVFFLFGGRKLLGQRAEVGGGESGERFERRQREQAEGGGPAPVAGSEAATANEVPPLDPRQDPHADRHRLADRRRAPLRRGRRLRRALDRGRPLADRSRRKQGCRRQGGLADRAADLRHRHVRRPAGGARHDRLAGRPGGHHQRRADRRSADPLRRRRRLGVRVDDRHPRRADPLAVPFLETGAVGAVGLIIALSISSSVVDSSPFSTSGALTVANTPDEHRDYVFKRLMQWGLTMVLIIPPIAWLIFVVPGWL